MQTSTILIEVSSKNKDPDSKTKLLSQIIERDTSTEFEFSLQAKMIGRYIEISLPASINVKKIKKSLRKENFIVWLVVEPSLDGHYQVTFARETHKTSGLKIWDLFLEEKPK